MCQPAARAFGEGWGTLPSRPWPSLVRQHERSLEPYPAWLSLERETVERPIESAGIGVGEGRQHMRRESGRVGGIAEHAAPAFEIAVDEIVPLDAAAFRTTGGQIFASHRLRIPSADAVSGVERVQERLREQSDAIGHAPGHNAAMVLVPSSKFQKQPALHVREPAPPAGHASLPVDEGDLVEPPESHPGFSHQPRKRRTRVDLVYFKAHDPPFPDTAFHRRYYPLRIFRQSRHGRWALSMPACGPPDHRSYIGSPSPALIRLGMPDPVGSGQSKNKEGHPSR